MQVVGLVRKYIDSSRFWKISLEEQKEILSKLLHDICQLYGIEGVSLVVDINSAMYRVTGGGCYVPSERKIYLYKISVMTFLHEVGHLILGQDEWKVMMWSHKVFFLSFPDLYLKNVQKGRFLHAVSLQELEKFNEGIK